MPKKGSQLSGTYLGRFIVFCHHVSKVKETPDLINFVAGELDHVNFCRDIIGSDKTYQARFDKFCLKNNFNAEKIRRRLGVVATVLGVGKRVDYYQVLGVSPDADDQTIRKAYRQKAPHFHPDKVGGNKIKSDKFVELHAAYVHLSDPIMRSSYDQLMQGKEDWTEGQRSRKFEMPKEGPELGRFISWLCVLIGCLVCIVVVFNNYQKRSAALVSKRPDISQLEESNTKFRARGQDTVATQKGVQRDPKQVDRAIESSDLRRQITGRQPTDPDKRAALSGAEKPRLFYHARREKRFWVSYDSRHESFEEAIRYMAAEYRRSPNWVTKHMGNTNDLEAIHRNLLEQQSQETIAENKAREALLASLPDPEKQDAGPVEATIVVGTEDRTEVETKDSAEAGFEDRTEVEIEDRAEAGNEDSTEAKPALAPLPVKKEAPPPATPKKATTVVKAPVPPAPIKAATVVAAQTSSPETQSAPAAPQVVDKQRILVFLDNYATAYEQKDLDKFETFFAEDAIEMGKPFKTLLPTYRKTFDSIDALKYRINLKAFSLDKIAKTIQVNGEFSAEYRLPEKDWNSRSGSIRMELLDSAEGLLVKRLEYQADQ